MERISLVVPCFNEEETVKTYYKKLEEIKIKDFKDINIEFEYIFVNDGSTDNTLKEIKKIASINNNVKYISLSKNFGKEAAMYAGLKNSTGDYITAMDVDLQEPPELLKKMYDLLQSKEYDSIGTRRVTRKGEPKIRSFLSKIFYRIINKISNIEMVDGARDYRLFTRQMLNSILELEEYNRYSKGLFSFVGYNTKWLEYENLERIEGKTKWSFFDLFRYALEGIVAFSTTPLIISSLIGMILCVFSFVFGIFYLFKTLIFGNDVNGWTSTICVISFIGGIQLFFLGIIGQYLAKTYLEVKKRPIYFIKEDNLIKIEKK